MMGIWNYLLNYLPLKNLGSSSHLSDSGNNVQSNTENKLKRKHPSDSGNNVQSNIENKLKRKHSRIDDDYKSLDQVKQALIDAGLESANLIVGIDFTKSNEWKASTHDKNVFSFYPGDRVCHGFEEALRRYKEIVPHLQLSGPTTFAPIIETAIDIVDNSGGRYHVLLIIADGQVEGSIDNKNGPSSPQAQGTIDAIVKASVYPLSIVMVGVGDGPWDMMKTFDDNIPAREFDNFQFVNFTEIMAKNIPMSDKETEFAMKALMEIPSQYKATQELHLLGCKKGSSGRRVLSPPIRNDHSSANSKGTSGRVALPPTNQ